MAYIIKFVPQNWFYENSLKFSRKYFRDMSSSGAVNNVSSIIHEYIKKKLVDILANWFYENSSEGSRKYFRDMSSGEAVSNVSSITQQRE